MQVYYNILEMIRTQLLGDVNVNTVTTGDIFDVDLDKQTIFPLSHVMVNQATRKDRVYTLNISVLLMDIVDKVNYEATDKFRGNDNEQDVFNTQLSVGGRLVEMLKRGDLREDNFELTNDPNFEPFTERFENSLAGWALTFDVDVPNTMTVCDVPIVPPSCLAADYSIIDEDGNVLYSGSIASGGSLEQEIQNSTAIVKNSEGTTLSTTSILAEGTETITANDALVGLLNSGGTVIGGDSFPSGTANNITAPDATIKNSLGTTLDSAPSGADTVLPDIPNIDSNGATVNTPAQVPFVCTPCVNDVPQVWADMFEGRVLFDGGTFEDKTNLVTEFTDNFDEYNDAIGAITPSGYKAGTLYGFKPFDGSIDLSWTRATDATRFNESGLIETVSSNVPRIDYKNGEAVILVEPSAENILLHNNDLTNPVWTSSNLTVVSETLTSPEGNTTSQKIIPSSGLSNFAASIRQSITKPSTSKTYSATFFIQSDGLNKIATVYRSTSSANRVEILISDIDNKTYTVTEHGGFSLVSHDMVDSYNGWKIFTITFTSDSDSSIRVYHYLPYDEVTDGVKGVFLSTQQIEENSTPTSVIPTTTTAATRNADVATNTPPIGTTKITEYFEGGSTNEITTIPATYTMSEGCLTKVIFE